MEKSRLQWGIKRFARPAMLNAGTVEKTDTMPACAERDSEKQNRKKTNTRKNVYVVHPKSPWRSSDEESGEEVEVMLIDKMEEGADKPFVLKGPLQALIDTGSPVTIFTKTHIQKVFGKAYKLQQLKKNEKYIDVGNNKIDFFGAMTVQVDSERESRIKSER